MKISYPRYLPMIKAISDGIRLQIVEMLSCGPMCACDILESFAITQPTLSYHMKLLAASGLVTAERKGAWMFYSLQTDNFESLLEFLRQVATKKEGVLWSHLQNCGDGVDSRNSSN